ncbi:Histone deacetylase complex subunit SAP130 [Myotis brandtii]|uniref:Histone deacetylase complex subunit SAP130 n=1 Tax=Myotis brandtii TaxID=109478 RepID=S7P848_MYOBR|nr:Histone deacetylase complex subunit SAP130 [Myotis brandtii]
MLSTHHAVASGTPVTVTAPPAQLTPAVPLSFSEGLMKPPPKPTMRSRPIAPAPPSTLSLPPKASGQVTVTMESSLPQASAIPVATISGQQGHPSNLHHIMTTNVQMPIIPSSAPGPPLHIGASHLPRVPPITLLRHYRNPRKAAYHHFQRYSDVQVKEEKKAMLQEIASQKGVSCRAQGWKVHLCAAQLLQRTNLEHDVYERLTTLQEGIIPKKKAATDEDLHRIDELIQGNMQRCKLVMDQISEARDSMLKVLDHIDHRWP